VIPDYLKKKDQWIVWTSENRKVPYAPWNDPDPIDPLDSSNWTSYERALQFLRHRGFDGMGFVFKPDSDVVGIDLDDCVEETMIEGDNVSVSLSDPHQKIVDVLDSFTEISQSGTGIHVFVRGDVGGQLVDNEVDIEIYDRKRFFCMTGKVVTDYSLDVEQRDEKLQDISQAFLDTDVEEVETPSSDDAHTGNFDYEEYFPSSDSEFDKLSIDRIFPDLDIPCKTGHPVHGSHTGQNFLVHSEEGFTATCFRGGCSVGGSPGCLMLPQHLLAMKAFDYQKCCNVREDWCLELRINTWVYAVENLGLNPLEIPTSIKAGLGDEYDVDPFAGGRESVSVDGFLKERLAEDYGVEWF
jgi:hypothetical protein